MRDSYRVVRGWIARINAFLQENITGMSTVQLFRREALNFARFDEIDRKHRDANIESIFYYAVFYPAIEVVSALASALIIWYGGGSVLPGITLGALVAFLQYSQRFFRPISDMSEKFNVLQSAMASSERIFKLLDEPVVVEPPRGRRRGRRRRRGAHRVRRRLVRLQRRRLRAQGRELRGPARRARRHRRRHRLGKTTLINLLLRFYDVKRGRITIDGVDIRELDLADVRGLFSLVLQDVHLFSGTIADNIRLGNPSIDDARIERAARAVTRILRQFIKRLPHGIRRRCGRAGLDALGRAEAAAVVSRALAFDPRVLILDEATSSVDTETELLIRDALRVLMAGRTTIAIAHRLSTISGHGQDPRAAQRRLRSPARIRSCSRSAASTSSCSSCGTQSSASEALLQHRGW